MHFMPYDMQLQVFYEWSNVGNVVSRDADTSCMQSGEANNEPCALAILVSNDTRGRPRPFGRSRDFLFICTKSPTPARSSNFKLLDLFFAKRAGPKLHRRSRCLRLPSMASSTSNPPGFIPLHPLPRRATDWVCHSLIASWRGGLSSSLRRKVSGLLLAIISKCSEDDV